MNAQESKPNTVIPDGKPKRRNAQHAEPTKYGPLK